MSEIILGTVDSADLLIDERELAARLGENPRSESLSELVRRESVGVSAAATPKYSARRLPLEFLSDGALLLGSERVESEGLRKCLFGSYEAIIFAVTLGVGVDRYISKRRVSSEVCGFAADAVGSALAEALCDYAERKICSGLSTTKRFSPGYSDLSLSNQGWILDFLDAGRLLGITLTDSSLMIPMKSVTAIIGVKNG